MVPLIRIATAADDRVVRRVIAAAYGEFESALSPELYEAYLANLVDLEARRSDSVLLVAEVDGEVVGAVSFYPDAAAEGFGWPRGWAGIRALAVDPASRGHGTGRALVLSCIERATLADSPVICLHTASFMKSAVALYETLGFTRAPEFDVKPVDIVGVDDPEGPVVIAYRLDQGQDR